MGEGIRVLLWSGLKVGYIGDSMRRLEQVCDVKASVILQMLCALYCSAVLGHLQPLWSCWQEEAGRST